jgi:hypothetical protein
MPDIWGPILSTRGACGGHSSAEGRPRALNNPWLEVLRWPSARIFSSVVTAIRSRGRGLLTSEVAPRTTEAAVLGK